MARYNGNLADLWVQAGGDPKVANIAAAIAMAESGGRIDAWNPTGLDKSAGLWQINYHGALREPRTRQFGPPELLRRNPLANAKAAVAIYQGAGNSFSPWTTFTGGQYKQHLGSQPAPRTGSSPGLRQPRPARASGSPDATKQHAQNLINLALGFAREGRISPEQAVGFLGSTRELAQQSRLVSPKGSLTPPSPRKGVTGSVVDRVLAAAHTQIGKPYVFGSGPSTESFDCSDLVQWAYGQVGVNIPRTTYEQMKVLPKKNWKNLQPGDLLYKNDGGHVVMYVGGGKVIAAPYTGTVVQYQPLSRFRDGGNYHVRSVM